jgi:hypothetical protein
MAAVAAVAAERARIYVDALRRSRAEQTALVAVANAHARNHTVLRVQHWRPDANTEEIRMYK